MLETTAGNIRIKLYNDTPLHRDNFIKNVKDGKYDGVMWHRIIRNFMIQTGEQPVKFDANGDLRRLYIRNIIISGVWWLLHVKVMMLILIRSLTNISSISSQDEYSMMTSCENSMLHELSKQLNCCMRNAWKRMLRNSRHCVRHVIQRN